MSVNIYVLHIDSSGEGLERAVIESVQGSHQAKILCYPLSERLSQRMVMNREPNVTAEQGHGFEFRIDIGSVAGATPERYHSCELASRFKRCDALE